MPDGLLGIEELDRAQIEALLARAKDFQPLQHQSHKKLDTLKAAAHPEQADAVAGAVLVGVGNLGTALLGYRGFENLGLRIAAAFEARIGNDPAAEFSTALAQIDRIAALRLAEILS